MTPSPRVLDLFRGAGGWSVACQRLGLDDHGVELMAQANATAAAAGHRTLYEDVWAPPPMVTRPLSYDGLIASPPCQTFSQAGKGAGREALDKVLQAIEDRDYESLERLQALAVRVGDPRTALVLTPLFYAATILPEWIVLEQVPTVLPVWEAYAEVLRSWGYSVWTGNLHAEQYGVPQTRKRAVLIANAEREVSMPTPTHSKYYPRDPQRLDSGVKKWISMAEGLGWGLAARPSYTVMNSGHGGTGGEWGSNAVRQSLRDAAGSEDPEKWREKGWGLTDRPAPTITGGGTDTGGAEPIAKWSRYTGREDFIPSWAFERPATTIVGSFRPDVVAAPGYRTTVSRQNAPDSVRVTVEEAGILQSFPVDYPWQGAKTKQYLQVGNAIPPLLADAVLREAIGCE